ncbi:C-type lectin domain family 4 member G-like [Fundulus heteroclitus]|uniref:C-type lectin domain family 4 member G-like n=1 Tax=Fundulus heteroclitus TaxID=8078 RepID=UPI00165A903E|nr:C-type lectin domain family 4 member G-like [Fundulus heteroclitus]
MREENLHLVIKKSIVEIVLEPLISERDDLKMALEVLMSFNNIAMNQLCPDKQCLPCQAGWLSFLERCSSHYNQGSPHKTWRGTRPYCQNTSADLVVVDDLSKQTQLTNEVIMDFCSLTRTENNWFWIDGDNETLGFWIDDADSTGSYAVMLYVWLFNKNWTQPSPGSWNNSICDQQALKRLI